MLGKLMLIIVFAVVLLFCCWMLVNYLLHKIYHLPYKGGTKARLGTKTAFALTNFLGAVEAAKELKAEVLKSKMSRAELNPEEDKKR